MSIEYEDQKWPICTIRFGSSFTDSEFAAVTDRLKAWMSRHEPFGIVCDTTGAQLPSANQRKFVAEYFERDQAALSKYVIGWANVIPSTLARGVIMAISWIAKPPFPFSNFADSAAGEAWLRDNLAARR